MNNVTITINFDVDGLVGSDYEGVWDILGQVRAAITTDSANEGPIKNLKQETIGEWKWSEQ